MSNCYNGYMVNNNNTLHLWYHWSAVHNLHRPPRPPYVQPRQKFWPRILGFRVTVIYLYCNSCILLVFDSKKYIYWTELILGFPGQNLVVWPQAIGEDLILCRVFFESPWNCSLAWSLRVPIRTKPYFLISSFLSRKFPKSVKLLYDIVQSIYCINFNCTNGPIIIRFPGGNYYLPYRNPL